MYNGNGSLLQALHFCNAYILYKKLLTATGLSPGGSGYFTCIQNMKYDNTNSDVRGILVLYIRSPTKVPIKSKH